jgi:hypothetical protein
MSDFGPFMDFSEFSDDELWDRVGKLNARIEYYYQTSYNYLIPQLQQWVEEHFEELRNREDKRYAEKKAKKNKNKVEVEVEESSVIFDNSDEQMAKDRAIEDEKKAKLKAKLKLKLKK